MLGVLSNSAAIPEEIGGREGGYQGRVQVSTQLHDSLLRQGLHAGHIQVSLLLYSTVLMTIFLCCLPHLIKNAKPRVTLRYSLFSEVAN